MPCRLTIKINERAGIERGIRSSRRFVLFYPLDDSGKAEREADHTERENQSGSRRFSQRRWKNTRLNDHAGNRVITIRQSGETAERGSAHRRRDHDNGCGIGNLN